MSPPVALVTGSKGFIGRHFTSYLREHGWLVFGIDILDGSDARQFFADSGPWSRRPYDLVIHAAAVVGGRHVIENDPLAQAVNLELDAGLFRWARSARPGRVIYFSSSAAYPVHLQQARLQHRLREDDIDPDGPRLPDQLYGWAKLTGEYLARIARQDGLAVTVVRPFSGYGADQDDTYPFPAFIDRALRREDPFTIWGDGSQVRDFVHVDDIVTTVMEMHRLDEDGPANIGWGRPVSMRELAGRICAVAGYAPDIKAAPAAPAGVNWRVCDPARLRGIREPRVTLEHGICDVLEYRKRLIAPEIQESC